MTELNDILMNIKKIKRTMVARAKIMSDIYDQVRQNEEDHNNDFYDESDQENEF